MVFDFIPNELEVWIWVSLVAGLIGWMSHQAHCLRIQRKRTWRLERGFILSMKLTAKLTKRAHANEPDIVHDVDEIEEFVNVVLRDESIENDDFKLFK